MGKEEKKEILAHCPYCNGVVIRRATVKVDTEDQRETVFDMNCPNCGRRVKLKLGVKIEIARYEDKSREYRRLQQRRR